MDYQAALIGECCHGETTMWVRVVVPVTSLCPCSKKISERGAHNQRSHVTIKARLHEHMWIEELIDVAEVGGLVRAVRHPQAPGREIRDRTRL